VSSVTVVVIVTGTVRKGHGLNEDDSETSNGMAYVTVTV